MTKIISIKEKDRSESKNEVIKELIILGIMEKEYTETVWCV